MEEGCRLRRRQKRERENGRRREVTKYGTIAGVSQEASLQLHSLEISVELKVGPIRHGMHRVYTLHTCTSINVGICIYMQSLTWRFSRSAIDAPGDTPSL